MCHPFKQQKILCLTHEVQKSKCALTRRAAACNMNQPIENRLTFHICNSSLAHSVLYHIVGLVYNYRNSLSANFTGDEKRSIMPKIVQYPLKLYVQVHKNQ